METNKKIESILICSFNKIPEALFKSEKILQMDHSDSEPSKNLFRISEQASKEILDSLLGDSDLDLSNSRREVRISRKILTYLKE
jgi:hypothetical protein